MAEEIKKREVTRTTVGARIFPIPNSYYGGITLIDSQSNCKLTSIEGINNLMNVYNVNDRVALTKEMLTNCRILVFFNTNTPGLVKFFEDNFEIYSVSKAPVGYGGGYQYHVLLRNGYSKASNIVYLRKKEDVANLEGIEKIKAAITSVMKSKRRKTDIVDEIIQKIEQ